MRLFVATVVAATMMLSACDGSEATKPALSAPAPAAVGVSLQTAQPQYPRGTAPKIDMVLRNNGGRPCKLPSSATGAVEVLSVTRDSQAVIAKGGTDSYYNGLSAVVADNLQSVPPGQSLTVPLDIETMPNSPPTLVASLQTPSDEGRTTSWPLDQPGSYRITARPAQVAGITDMCAVPSTSSTVEFGVQP